METLSLDVEQYFSNLLDVSAPHSLVKLVLEICSLLHDLWRVGLSLRRSNWRLLDLLNLVIMMSWFRGSWLNELLRNSNGNLVNDRLVIVLLRRLGIRISRLVRDDDFASILINFSLNLQIHLGHGLRARSLADLVSLPRALRG